MVAVQIVHCAASPDQKVAVLTEGSNQCAYARVQMRIEARVHADDGGGWAAAGEHADQDEVGVVNPVKGLVGAGVDATFPQRCDAFLAGGQVRDELIVLIFARVDVGHGRLCGLGVHGYVDPVYSPCVPVRAHHDNAFDAALQRLVAAGFPVVGRPRLLAQHHGGAMREEVDWGNRHVCRFESSCSVLVIFLVITDIAC